MLGILALAALAFVYRAPARPRTLMLLTFGIGADILVQGLLGFATLNTSGGTSNALALAHFLNALAIYRMSLAGTFMAMAAAKMSQAHQMGPVPQ